jgi:predicted Fe-Mo cluster-binding NifX family protein
MQVLGFVENMSGFVCSHCGERLDIFKTGGAEKASKELDVPLLGKIPLEAGIVEAGDAGKPFIYFNDGGEASKEIRKIINKVIETVESSSSKEEKQMDKVIKKVRVALPTSDRENVEEHFGHCREFAIFNVEGNDVSSPEYVTPPPHAPGVIIDFLNGENIGAVITGGMGQRAIDLFREKEIEVILGATGTIETNLNEYLKGALESRGSACSHNHGEHSCSN